MKLAKNVYKCARIKNIRIFVLKMGNKQPTAAKRTFTEIVTTNAYAKSVLERNREGLQRFIRNNARFLSESNKSVYRQCKDLSERSSLKILPQLIYGIKVGKQKVCSTYIVYLVGDYWGIDGATMLTTDYECLPKVA